MKKIDYRIFQEKIFNQIRLPMDFNSSEITKYYPLLIKEILAFNKVSTNILFKKNTDRFSTSKTDLKKLISPLFVNNLYDDDVLISVNGNMSLQGTIDDLLELNFYDAFLPSFGRNIDFQMDDLFFFLKEKKELFFLERNGQLNHYNLNSQKKKLEDKFIYPVSIFKDYDLDESKRKNSQRYSFVIKNQTEGFYRNLLLNNFQTKKLNKRVDIDNCGKLIWEDAVRLEKILEDNKVRRFLRKDSKLHFRNI